MAELIGKNNTLTSTSTTEALTAAQGKALQDKKLTYAMGTTTPTSSSFIEDGSVYIQYGSENGLSSNIISAILNAVYPVGSIYISVNSTSPATLFGGSWTQLENRFLLGAGSSYTAGATDGAASVTSGGTALTTNQIPAHTHGSYSMSGWIRFRNMTNKANIVSGSTNSFLNYYAHDSASGDWSSALSYTGVTHKPDRVDINATHEHASVGGGAAHTHSVSTMPPYLVVYMWKRTA